MDNEQSRSNNGFDLSLQGIAIQPGGSSSRPSSARRNSQTKQPPTPTSSREGSARERKANLNTSANFSSARQRRHSNSSQRSIGLTSPRPQMKQPTTTSTSSTLFRVSRPPQPDADGFFTDQSQQKSDDSEVDDTRRWVDELHELNASFTPPPPPTRDIGFVGMSRDSLNGTFAGNHHHRPTNESFSTRRRTPEEEDATIKIQRWYRQNSTKTKQKKDEDIPDEKTPTPSPIIFREQEKNGSRRPSSASSSSRSSHQRTPKPSPIRFREQETNGSRRPSSASSRSSHPRTPKPSSRPPSARSDRVKATTTGSIPSASSSTSTVTSKVTLEDVYETLKKLEEVEQFPVQPPLKDDSAYLIDPTVPDTQPPFIKEFSLPTPDEFEPNQYDLIVGSVRSQRSLTRETSSPTLIRFATPPQSSRRQQSTRVVQSVSVPQNHASSSTVPSKSMMVGAPGITSRSISDYDRDFDYQLQVQKSEYEAIIQRHLKFIDQLFDDKKKLSARCELLVSELKTIDRKCNDRIRSIEEFHRLEIQQLKDVHESAERIRRERWIEDKTRKIKELTVRGLEPEIQKLISKHKNEIAKLKTVHEAELLTADERASQRYIRLTEELRDQLEREKEVAIARERELAREKYEKALRDEEQSFNEQRRRLHTEIEEEKNRQAELAGKQRADIDKLRRDIEENHRTVVDSTKRDYEATRLEQERRYANEINALKEKLAIDQRNFEENCMKEQETLLAKKERELREQMKQERDREIEKIIAQFETDTTSTKEDAEHVAETRVKRLQDKYQAELQELENSEKQMKEKYHQSRTELLEVQVERDRLHVLLKQKESEFTDIKKITDALQQERERLSDIIREEFAARLVSTDDENRRVKNEIAELRARQQLELAKKQEECDALRAKQDKELEEIHEKIKQAITKKDEQVQKLRTQYEAVVKRAEHLDNLLTQQRKIISTRAKKSTQPS